jgi:hypothetical protein
MWYTNEYANTLMCAPAQGGRAGNPGDRSPVAVRLYSTPLPDAPRQPDRPRRATIGPPGPRAVRLAPGEADADQRPVSSARHRNYPTPREGRNPSQKAL